MSQNMAVKNHSEDSHKFLTDPVCPVSALCSSVADIIVSLSREEF